MAGFHVMADKWASHEVLPDGLDETQAVPYQETAEALPPRLGGRWLVWPDQVWRQRPEGTWQRSLVTQAELDSDSRWERVDA
jgi:hypothetical protein